ncbi:indole-3-glycerol phosphate synthase TrpC [Fructilactobacillus myrtifloralis]|uniref:Indole-3-glycerol phosphate synthase n=1 Tax=Fructilactobacillus myrtifloralis TaxID=2940301 RepID=A0ABY5BPI7_9LACO|nr:indole-3-glycerol phosphate synthase TrpC [Fructilactobacillus myrtifloralis]USS85587.1 indole-3-glycerol phosphate synthase TrpC [Fructilactobacillus myrtifloralis]
MILDDLTNVTKARVARAKAQQPLAELQEQVEARDLTTDFPFERALHHPHLSFICEIKRASPSKGDIKTTIDVAQLARAYAAAGASAISVLTEPDYFKGSLTDLETVAQTVSIPVLRKDFTVDPYMIYAAKQAGASAILLICAILSDQELREFFALAEHLGLSAIFEAHNATEVQRAIAAGARIIGINNRNLKNFTVNFDNAKQLREAVPADTLMIAESGVKTAADIRELSNLGVDGVLVGETMMLAAYPREKLEELRDGEN